MISRMQAVVYEVESSWWACHLSHPWLQKLSGKYFAWKVRRKLGRCEAREARLVRALEYLKSKEADRG